MIAPEIRGKGKTILDITNPFLKRPDGYGAGLPKDGPQSGIEVAESGRGNGRAELLANRAALGMWCGVGCYLSAVTAGF